MDVVPLIECACGCGTKFPKYNRWGKPRRYVRGHNGRGAKYPGQTRSPEWKAMMSDGRRRGLNSPSWKGGRIITNGYVFIYRPDHPQAVKRYVLEHRLIMEQYLGRYLKPEEIVHHVNKITEDNRIENLQLFSSNGEHLKFELTGRSSPLKGRKIHSDEWKQERRQKWTGKNNPNWLGKKASERAKRRRK